jgi:alcohol dehydrogenase
MDAFTQLMESYVSLRANPFTDGLALSGLQAVREGFFPAWEGGAGDKADRGRAAMSYAALISGITLAQAGLGSVHGLAQPLGSFFPIPHGVACGTTVAAATAVNIAALRERAPDNPALTKYAELGRLFSELPELKDEAACDALVDALRAWTNRLAIPRLGEFGVTEGDLTRIVANSRGNSMKTNPVELTDEEIGKIVLDRL